MISPSFQPLAEQERARELFLRREGLKIDSYAGTGKTTTLHLLAASTRERGLYPAFNRSIADEARSRFPAQVTCATTHSIAFRGVRRSLGYPEWKLSGSLTAHGLRTGCKMPENIAFQAGLSLSDRSYSALLLDALRRFLQSDEEEPEARHVPRLGLLGAITDMQFQAVQQKALEHITAIWDAMRHKDGNLPLGHDGYLKLWALSRPRPGWTT